MSPEPFSTWIEQPNTPIEIGRKGHPEEIRDLQPPGGAVHLKEGQQHPQDQGPKHCQPDKGKAEILELKENDAPKEVESELD
jgi:hypothetical protein